MALTTEQWQALITSELKPAKLTAILQDGGAAADEFATNLPLWWEMHEDKQVWGPRLRYLYTKLQGIEWLTGQTWDHIDYGDADVNERLSQYHEHLTGMLQGIEAEIAKLEARRRAGSSAMGTMAKTAPRMPGETIVLDTCQPDPNDPMYRGDTMRRHVPPVYPR